jgi:hypothetical protein
MVLEAWSEPTLVALAVEYAPELPYIPPSVFPPLKSVPTVLTSIAEKYHIVSSLFPSNATYDKPLCFIFFFANSGFAIRKSSSHCLIIYLIPLYGFPK